MKKGIIFNTMIPIFIQNLLSRMGNPLPGFSAQEKMKVKNSRIIKNNNAEIPSAVLIILYPENNDWYFLLTKRAKNLSHHKGQISLPGGIQENRESYEQTALREANEEIGIKDKDIQIIGKLTSISVPVSNFKIFPFIGWVKKKPKMIVQENEVERVFSVSINELLNKKTLKEKSEVYLNRQIKIPYFDFGGEVVWGATSMILSELREIIKDIQ